MKAVILSFAGYDSPLIDITHMVEPGNILQGAYHLRATLPYLPAGSVTLAVVDPGVGSERYGLAALWEGRFIVAPDNGLISMLPGQIKTWILPEADPEASATFHGRDVFAPAAARLSIDPGWTSFLKPLLNPLIIDAFKPSHEGEFLKAQVLNVDNFGNCITDITTEDFRNFTPLFLSLDGNDLPLSIVNTYTLGAECDSLLLIKGSSGFFELAINKASASEKLSLLQGTRITLKGKRNTPQ